jgi:hypothetical protein
LRRGAGRLVEALLDLRIGPALDLVFGLLAGLFFGQTLLVLIVGLLACGILDGAALGVLGGALARDHRVAVGADQGAGAGFLLFLGQRAQHDATAASVAGRTACRRTRRCRRRGRAARRGGGGCAAQLQGAAARRRGWRLGSGRRRGRRRDRRHRPLDRLLDLDRHRARASVAELLAHLRLATLGRGRARARRGREGERLGRLGLFFLFRHTPVVLAPLRPVNRRRSGDRGASAPLRPQSVE